MSAVQPRAWVAASDKAIGTFSFTIASAPQQEAAHLPVGEGTVTDQKPEKRITVHSEAIKGGKQSNCQEGIKSRAMHRSRKAQRERESAGEIFQQQFLYFLSR